MLHLESTVKQIIHEVLTYYTNEMVYMFYATTFDI